MTPGSSQILVSHLLTGDRLNHIGACYVHLADTADHEDEVRQRGRVGRAAGGRPEYGGYLGHDSRRPRVAKEYLAVAGQTGHTLLNSRAAGVDQTDDRSPAVGRQIHHLTDLVGDGLRQRAAQHSEVLRIDEYEPTVNLAVTGDDGVSEEMLVGETELGGPVNYERVKLFEGTLVQKQDNALTGSQLAPPVLRLYPALPSAELCLLPLPPQLFPLLIGCSTDHHN